MATGTWFVMIPPGYASKTDAEKELVDFRIQYPAGSQAWKDANAGKIIQGSEGNSGNPQVSEQLVKWKGPFATEALAKTAQAPKQQSPNPGNDAVNAAENSTSLGILSDLTNPVLWVRVAKVVIGGTILIVGLAKLTGADKNAGKAVKSAVKFAPLL